MINVKCFSSQDTWDYYQRKYEEFLEYFLNTTLTLPEIWEKIGVCSRNNTARYIRKQLKKDGYDTDNRRGLIKKGEWL